MTRELHGRDRARQDDLWSWGMSRLRDTGTCEHCNGRFRYALIHNGFNDSAHAYCDRCGRTALLDARSDAIPEQAGFRPHGPIPVAAEPWLLPCECGGAFRAAASPRCPGCNRELSAEPARAWIESQAPGAAKGWRWQGSWCGIYAIVVEGRVVENNWRRPA